MFCPYLVPVTHCYVGRQNHSFITEPAASARGPRPVKRLDFMYFEAGGGHKAAANALKSMVDQQQRDWQVRLVNLQELLDPLDIFRKYTGIRMEDVYNTLLKKGWTLGCRGRSCRQGREAEPGQTARPRKIRRGRRPR